MESLSPEELELTQLEWHLKSVTHYRGNGWGIMTAQELNDFQQWMFDTFCHEPLPTFPPEEIARFPNITKKAALLERFRPDSPPPTVFSPFLIRSNVQEQEEIPEQHHIAVGRMLRYFPAHWHANDYFEIYYALSGACPVHFQNEVVTVKPGTVLIVAPSVVHATPCYEDDQVLLYFTIRSSTFDQVFWNTLPPDSLMSSFFRQALSSQHGTAYLHFETEDDPEIRSFLYTIYREFCASERYAPQLINALMSAFFVLLLRWYEGTARLPRRSDFYWKHEFSAILTYIQIHYASTDIKSVAQRFHYSPRQIGRIVQGCTGLTFADLILKLRMEQAEKLLSQKGTSIDLIAAAVGYSTSSSFFRAFAKYHGCTPRAYVPDTAEAPDATQKSEKS